MTKSALTASRSYSDQTLKLLWGRAAGRCAVSTCRVELYVEKTEHDPAVPIGDIAHMHAHGDSGPRAVQSLSAKQRNSYENLILLCKNCHARLDGQKNRNTVEVIQQIKFDHEAWVRASLPERGRSRVGWSTIIIEDQWPIDSLTFDAALAPDYAIGGPKRINVSVVGRMWPDVAIDTRTTLEGVLREGDVFDKRIAVFPLARITACLYVGYVLTNRPNVQLFQFHRDECTWAWPADAIVGPVPTVNFTGNKNPKHILFVFELSAKVNAEPFLHDLPDPMVVTLALQEPSTQWLKHPEQLRQLGMLARNTFENALNHSSPDTTWHILYAGPAPGAVKVGQQLNPTMTPPTQLYEYTYPGHMPSLKMEHA